MVYDAVQRPINANHVSMNADGTFTLSYVKPEPEEDEDTPAKLRAELEERLPSMRASPVDVTGLQPQPWSASLPTEPLSPEDAEGGVSEVVRAALCEHMAYLSEEYWSAGWLNDLDKICQYAVIHGNRTPNDKYQQFSPEDFEKLKILHEAAGGWWVWDDAVDWDGPGGNCVRFVPDAAPIAQNGPTS
jgi:hypothetical protein